MLSPVGVGTYVHNKLLVPRYRVRRDAPSPATSFRPWRQKTAVWRPLHLFQFPEPTPISPSRFGKWDVAQMSANRKFLLKIMTTFPLFFPQTYWLAEVETLLLEKRSALFLTLVGCGTSTYRDSIGADGGLKAGRRCYEGWTDFCYHYERDTTCLRICRCSSTAHVDWFSLREFTPI